MVIQVYTKKKIIFICLCPFGSDVRCNFHYLHANLTAFLKTTKTFKT